MCNIGEGYYEKGLEKGIAQGVTQANIETAKKLLKLNSYTFKQIAELVSLPVEEVEKLATVNV